MPKKVLIELTDSAHETLKKESSNKGMKFYKYLANELEMKASRLEKKNEQQS